ncbi:hypothetical protein ACHHYP_06869 [Achlya hypogyna]|uniref:EF-hand domain-containing protein n=1 Tax=Achlya hypogyna TaxID=1202772 RepID=A0A1V9YRN7_ACHHY|nr:hypothetical protein ACHHYP_06869 [Achlya hypogyna]
METLAKLFAATPDTDEVSLAHCHLYSLEPLVPLLKQFKELRHLDVSHNALTGLPLEMAQLARLVALDISGNPFPSVQHVLPVLTGLPSLKSLSITFASTTDEALVMTALPRLRILNGAPLPFGPSSAISLGTKEAKTRTSPVSWGLPTEHVQNVASIVSVLKGIGTPIAPQSEEDLRITRMFDQQMELVSMALKQETAAGDFGSAAMLHAKFKILAASTSLATQKAGECNAELGLAIQSLTFLHHELITSYHTLVQSLIEKQQQEAQVAPAQLQQLLDVAEGLEADLQESAAALAAEKKRAAQLQEENLRLRHQLGDTRPRSPSAYGNEGKSMIVRSEPPPPPPLQPRKQLPVPPQVPHVLIKKDKVSRESNNSRTRAPTARPEAPETAPAKCLALSPAPSSAVKNLTLKQLRDMIQAIYASKKKHDEMCIENEAPKETMEQHMYTYLNQRFGLQTLIVEYASAIMKGCSRYMQTDADVATFFHVVRNEVDEGFLRLKSKLEETVVALLRAFLRGLYPRKSEGAINRILQAKLSDQTLLSEEEWHSVVKYMYDSHDSHSIVRLVETHMQHEEASNNAKSTRGIGFSILRKILLNYQMHGRLRMLEDFCRHFEQVDTETVGVIPQKSFIELVMRYTPYKTQDEIEALVQLADPFGNDAITFSEVVEVLFKDIRSHKAQNSTIGYP